MRALITGNSSGLGLGFTRVLLERGWEVFGLSRRGCNLEADGLRDVRCDLARVGSIPDALSLLLDGVERLELLVLNAGVLGEIRLLRDTPLDEIKQAMDVNVWANKVIIDWLAAERKRVEQAVFISSGAAVNGHKGWGAYALSKAALNMLVKLYAEELPDTHLLAVAPGLVDTAMQDYLCEQVDTGRFPSVERLAAARGTEQMPGPDEAARKIVDLLPRLAEEFESGDFMDVRDL